MTVEELVQTLDKTMDLGYIRFMGEIPTNIILKGDCNCDKN